MENEHEYHVVAWWSSGKTGLAKSNSAPNAIHFTAPAVFGGVEGRWTPEDLLMSALASCFTTTFQAIAQSSKFEYNDLEVEAVGVVKKESGGYGFCKIVLRPSLTVSDEDKRERATALLLKARELCLVSRALAAEPAFETNIKVARPASA